jgi:hypothetical protein
LLYGARRLKRAAGFGGWMDMHPRPLAVLAPIVGRIAALFAAAGGVFMLLKRLRIDVHGIGAPFIWLFLPALAVLLVTYLAQLPAATLVQAADFLFGRDKSEDPASARRGVAIAAVFFLVVFAVLLAKNADYLKTQFDIRWHIAFLNYDLNWYTPVFSLAGNILYQFEIQPPFNTSLAPLNGLAHFVSPAWQIAASYVLFFVAMGALLWAVGHAAGLKLIPRTICAALVALITTIPYGLDHLLPFLPPPFVFVSQAMLTRVYEELGILSLTTAILFFWVGQRRTFVANAALAIAFAAACYVVLLAYPALAFFATPVIVVYCSAFLLTAASTRELWWKLSTGTILLATMLAAHIPLFFKNLYSYTYGAYFSDRILNSASRLIIWKNATVLGVFWPDNKVLLLCLVSCASAIFFVVRGRTIIRRFAIAMLAGEAGVFAVGGVMAYLHYPVSLYYSDQLQAPIPVFFFTLPLLFAAAVLAQRGDALLGEVLEGACRDGKLAPAFADRCIWYFAAGFLFLAVSPFIIPRERPFENSAYPPAEPASVAVLQKELSLTPGKPFAGRVFTLVRQDFRSPPGGDMNPLLAAVLGVVEDRYGRYTGNDHWTDLLNLNIPVVGEYGQWASPIGFVLMREFFGRKDDVFQKSLFLLRAYNDRIAHMVGIRYVVTDAADIPGGTLVYQQMTGDTPLRLFRIDGTNLGQYSPTRAIHIAMAAEGLAALKSATFDPRRDVLVEQDVPADLVPGTLQSLTVDKGPSLHVKATSPGTSLLVLPFEYSHCLRLKVMNGTARLIPVNLQQTGLLFDGSADVEIDYRFGPLANPTCRGDDLARVDVLHVHDALK